MPDKQRQRTYKLTRMRLLEYISSAAKPLTRNNIREAFTAEPMLDDKIARALKYLIRHKHIKTAPTRSATTYEPLNPYADTVYATVTDRKVNGKRLGVDIWGRPKDSLYRAHISQKDMRAHGLKTGDTVVINIKSGSGFSRAAQVLQKCDGSKPYFLEGYYNGRASGGARFEAANVDIKTGFNLRSGLKFQPIQRGMYDAVMPRDMKIFQPEVVMLKDDGTNRQTGGDINRTLLRKYDVPYRYPSPALVEAAALEHRPFLREYRIDMTDRGLITIDPPDAKDLDDAVEILKLDRGWRMTVAIADLGEQIPHGSALDIEAYRRGNTFYLPEKNYQLYPNAIVAKYSLLGGQERPASVYEAYFDEDFNLVQESTGFAVMRSKRQLAYDDYYKLLADGDPQIKTMHAFHQGLQEKFWEAEKGRQFSNRILQNSESGYISHGLIETAMVMANQGVGRELHAAGIRVPFRNHGPMVNPEGYQKMVQELRYLGIEMSDNPYDCDWATLNRVLSEAEERGITTRVEEVIRSDFYDRAFYEPESRGHFALGIEHYAHFTSPIRRYPDQVVARGLRLKHGIKKGALTPAEMDKMDEICAHLSRQNRLDKDIQSDRGKYTAIRHLKPGEERAATVLHVGVKDVEILLTRNGLRNRLTPENLADAGWQIDAENRELVRSVNGEEERVGRDGRIKGKIGAVRSGQALWEFVPNAAPEPDMAA